MDRSGYFHHSQVLCPHYLLSDGLRQREDFDAVKCQVFELGMKMTIVQDVGLFNKS